MKFGIAVCVIILSCVSSRELWGQSWSLEVTPEGYTHDYILLAYYLGNAQYIRDTARLADNHYVFSGNDTLQSGTYLVIFPPDNQYFQLMVGDGEDHIKVKVRMDDINHPYQIRGSAESSLFYDYIAFLEKERPQADSLRALIDSLPDGDTKTQEETTLKDIDASVKTYQDEILKKHPESLTALVISSNTDAEIPKFEGPEDARQMQTYLYVKAHYFDHMPMKDPRLVRTPVLHQRIEYYINKLTPQIPDSIDTSLDFILQQFDPQGEAFRVYLVYFLNFYAKSNIVGMDAVYVHLVENYYEKGLATWTDKDVLDKLIKTAETLKPLLIGKTAPDLLMVDRDNHPVRLSEVDSPYTILFFWDPDCGHCKKAIPVVKDFYKTYQTKGVAIFAVCTCLQDEVKKCWDAIDDRGMGDWINVADPYLHSRYKQIYDIRSTPQIYVLDRDKTILMKKIGAEQLPEIMDHLLENDSEK